MRVIANGLGIEVDDAGPRDAPAVLLVMGLGMQLTAWPQEFVALLVERGFRVIRFDNRDIGLSDGFEHAGPPNVALAALRHTLGLPVPAPYSVRDMAEDARGVLDALGIVRAHVCGASLGGMIAQHLAAAHPERVESLTLMMTTSGSRRLPGPTLRARVALLSRSRGISRDAWIDHSVRVFTTIGSPRSAPTRPGSASASPPATTAPAARPAPRGSCSPSRPTATARRCSRASARRRWSSTASTIR